MYILKMIVLYNANKIPDKFIGHQSLSSKFKTEIKYSIKLIIRSPISELDVFAPTVEVLKEGRSSLNI